MSLKSLRIVYAVLLALTIAFYFYDELHLRRWLFHHFGRDSFIAGSIPNFLAAILLSLGIALLRTPQNAQGVTQAVLPGVIGLSAYEVAQIWIPHEVFDWKDIAATLLGGAAVWVALYVPMRLLLHGDERPSQPGDA